MVVNRAYVQIRKLGQYFLGNLFKRRRKVMVENIIVNVAIADLRLVGNTFIKSFDDAPYPVRA